MSFQTDRKKRPPKKNMTKNEGMTILPHTYTEKKRTAKAIHIE